MNSDPIMRFRTNPHCRGLYFDPILGVVRFYILIRTYIICRRLVLLILNQKTKRFSSSKVIIVHVRIHEHSFGRRNT